MPYWDWGWRTRDCSSKHAVSEKFTCRDLMIENNPGRLRSQLLKGRALIVYC